MNVVRNALLAIMLVIGSRITVAQPPAASESEHGVVDAPPSAATQSTYRFSTEQFWKMLLDVLKLPPMQLNRETVAEALHVPPSQFAEVAPDADGFGGQTLGRAQGWYFGIDLPYEDKTRSAQGLFFSFIDEWPVKNSTMLPMCIDVARARADVEGAGWQYVRTESYYTQTQPSDIRFLRHAGDHDATLVISYNPTPHDGSPGPCVARINLFNYTIAASR